MRAEGLCVRFELQARSVIEQTGRRARSPRCCGFPLHRIRSRSVVSNRTSGTSNRSMACHGFTCEELPITPVMMDAKRIFLASPSLSDVRDMATTTSLPTAFFDVGWLPEASVGGWRTRCFVLFEEPPPTECRS